MTTKQETILKIARSGWFPDLSVGNFPKIHKDAEGSAIKNLEEALQVIEELGVGVFSISAQRPDVLNLISYASKRHPKLVAAVHSLMDVPQNLARAAAYGLYIPPSPKEARDSGAKVLTSLNKFSSETYDTFSHKDDPVLIAGAYTPNEWQEEWDKGANYVKFAGAELFPPNYMQTYMPSFHALIPFYVSGYIVKAQDATKTNELRNDKDQIRTLLIPFIKGGGNFVGTFTFGFGYPFNTDSREDMLSKGRILLEAITQTRKETKAPCGTSIYEAIQSANTYEELVKNTGRHFNA